jgi:hypothetical protein
MDMNSSLMISDAYDETVSEALAQGFAKDVAHKEGITAAAMFLASMTGLEDDEALQEVISLGLKPH